MSDQRGWIPVEFAAGFALLVLPVAVLMLLMPTWSQTQQRALAAARHGARLGVTEHPPVEQVEATVRDQLVRWSVSVERVAVSNDAASWRVEVTFRLPVVPVPLLGGLGAVSRTVSHREVADPYRSRP